MNFHLFRSLFAFFLLALSALSVAEEVSPEMVDGATTVDVNQAKALFEQEVLFVDVRKDSDWEAGRVPGAVHLNLKTTFSESSLAEEMDKDEAVVIYCNGPKCLRSAKAAKMAVDWGFTKLHFFRLGFPAWTSANLPVE